MLAVDNFVQDPFSTQSYNRYSYCINNPLKFVDPDGNWFVVDDVIAAGVGFALGYIGYGIMTGDWGVKALATAGVGALSAWLGYNTAGLASAMLPSTVGGFAGGAISGAVGGAVGGFIGGAGNAYIGGANMGEGLKAGAIGAGWGALGGALIGGVTNGIQAQLNGRSFWNGQYSNAYLEANGISLTGNSISEVDLQDFAENNFGERINAMEYQPSISINDVATGNNQAVTIPKNGYTKAGASDIFLKKSVLSNDKRLFYTLDHELTHASHFSDGSFARWELQFGHSRAVKISEFWAYHGGLSVANSWNDKILWQWTYSKMLQHSWR